MSKLLFESFLNEAFFEWLIFISAATLIVVWPLPHSMALRNLAYLVGVLSTFVLMHRYRKEISKKHLLLVLPLLLFFVWIIAHFLFLSELHEKQAIELKGIWFRSIMSTIVGAGSGFIIARNLNRLELKQVFPYGKLLYISLFSALFIYFWKYTDSVYHGGNIIQTDFYQFVFNQTKPMVIVFIGILITALLSKAVVQIYNQTDFWKLSLTCFLILLCLTAYLTSGTKNGLIIFSLVFSVVTIKLMNKTSNVRNLSRQLILLVPIILALLLYFLNNPAFKNMIFDILIGINIENNDYWKNWKDRGLPINGIGNEVNQSTYLRVSWIVAALTLIYENPFGYGLMSYSFSYLAKKKWPDFLSSEGNFMVDTHSGWVDLTLSFGLPAIFILISYSIYVYRLLPKKEHFWFIYGRSNILFLLLSFLLVEVAYSTFYELFFFQIAFFSMLIEHNKNKLV